MNKPRFFTLSAMIVLAALSRVVPHPWNFAPVAAMALFAGARFELKSQAFLVPLGALLLSDFILGFHVTMPFVYGAVCLTVLLGRRVGQKRNIGVLGLAPLSSSLLSFFITNFGYWLMTPAFPKSLVGLVQCYIVAIPFIQNTLSGDLIYTALFFGVFEWAERAQPKLQLSAVS